MAAWPECCQAAVPSQPFPELLVISHAQSDSQRQMVFKLNGCGRNLGAGLIGHAHARGLPRLGHSFQGHSHWMAVSRNSAIQTCHSMLICNFYLISTLSPRAAQSNCFGYDKVRAAWLYSAAGSCLTIIWHVALSGFLTDMCQSLKVLYV